MELQSLPIAASEGNETLFMNDLKRSQKQGRALSVSFDLQVLVQFWNRLSMV